MSRRTSSGSTTTSTSRIRSARCSSTSAAGGSAATTCSGGSGRRSPSTGWPRTSTATSTRRPSRPTRACTSRAPSTARATRHASRAMRCTPSRWAPISTRSCRSTGSISPTGGATGSCPRCSATSRYLEERLDAAGDMSLAETATLLEDAIDIHDRHWKIHWMLNFAQLSATLKLRAVMEKTRGSVDEDAAGTAPELGLGPQLGLDRGALADEERGPRRTRAADGVRARGRRRDRRRTARVGARPALHQRRHRAVPARIRLARRVEPRVHLPDRARADGAGPRADPRLPRHATTTSRRAIEAMRRRHRGRLGRDPRRPRAARRSKRCGRRTRSTFGWRR